MLRHAVYGHNGLGGRFPTVLHSNAVRVTAIGNLLAPESCWETGRSLHVVLAHAGVHGRVIVPAVDAERRALKGRSWNRNRNHVELVNMDRVAVAVAVVKDATEGVFRNTARDCCAPRLHYAVVVVPRK